MGRAICEVGEDDQAEDGGRVGRGSVESDGHDLLIIPSCIFSRLSDSYAVVYASKVIIMIPSMIKDDKVPH
jgi:hypothetical protein